jgi:L-lysine exporter family protein LysE/ArgO
MGGFFSYFVLGISLAAPIGPINAALLDKGIKQGLWHALIFMFGAGLADGVYMALVYMGVVQFLDMSFMKTFLYIFGAFVLIYTGIEGLLQVNDQKTANRNNASSPFGSFASGFIMSISNPLTILFWIGIYGSILAKTTSESNFQQLLINSLAMFIGIFCWDSSLAIIASSFRRLLSSTYLRMISIVSCLSLFGFGVYFSIQAFNILFR